MRHHNDEIEDFSAKAQNSLYDHEAGEEEDLWLSRLVPDFN